MPKQEDYLDDLERLAKAATPGPWCAKGHTFGTVGAAVGFCNGFQDGNETQLEVGLANAEFVAGACPAVILEMISEIRALRASVGRKRKK